MTVYTESVFICRRETAADAPLVAGQKLCAADPGGTEPI